MTRDTIYSLPQQRVGDFAFDDSVADVFPDMIARSVPGYASILAMIEQFTKRFSRSNTHLYDLGCSLGAATFLMQSQAPTNSKIIAVDNSEAMVSRLRQKLDNSPTDLRKCTIEVHQADVREFPVSNASFCVLNLTLQFIPIRERDLMLSAICGGMLPGGGLLLSEKLCFEDPSQQELLTELHHDFKRSHGYSDLEISQKRSAIENRLVPETLDQHVQRLRRSGFRQVVPWFQCFNFASILAVK